MFKIKRRGRRRPRIWEWIAEMFIISMVVRMVRRLLRGFFHRRRYT